MRRFPTKKSLKAGERQIVQMRFCTNDLNQFANEYGITPEEAFILWLEIQETYIELYFNYGYAVKNMKSVIVDDDILEYRFRAIIEKL